MNKALLVLADGLVFEGESFGAKGERIGEVVFNTSITGYQEILTDPSYKGQIVVMTYTQIGNYGVNKEDIESKGGPKVEGFIVKEYIDYPSNWRAKESLEEYLKKYNIVGIQGIDTRALTRHIRKYGSQMGIISTQELNPENLYQKVKFHTGIGGIDLVKYVTTPKLYKWNSANSKINKSNPFVVVYDFGIKLNILRSLSEVGFNITVVPAHTPAEIVIDIKPDAVLLSNGPGDPEAVKYGIENTKKLIGKIPIFGICLGHQILALAMGGRTYKLRFGHHGGNHPVKDLNTGKVYITSQNHNYCVDIKSLRGQAVLTHKNLYDGTEEGIKHVEFPIFSVQYHPEAAPGPNDSHYLFKKFKKLVTSGN